MAAGQWSTVLHHLTRFIGANTGGDATDRQLLERFVGSGDEDAFTTLVQRHGPLVWRVLQAGTSKRPGRRRRVSSDLPGACPESTCGVLAKVGGQLAPWGGLAKRGQGECQSCATAGSGKASRHADTGTKGRACLAKPVRGAGRRGELPAGEISGARGAVLLAGQNQRGGCPGTGLP
jgi:hypothetical protein